MIYTIAALFEDKPSPYIKGERVVEGKVGQTWLLPEVLLVGCGKDEPMSEKTFREIVKHSLMALKSLLVTEVLYTLTALKVKERDIFWNIQQIMQIFHTQMYHMTTFKHNHKTPVQTLHTLKLKIPHKQDLAKATRTITESQALVNAMTLTKNLANCPPNICTPEYLAQAAQALVKKYPKTLRIQIFNEKKIAALKMGALMAVGQGSMHPPRLITLEYRGRRDKQAPIVFVGKGITFDTGGLSLKSPTHMIGMKYDMCGAATVLGLMQFAAELHLPLNIVGLIPSAENMPDNTAYRPDDIITTLSGLTVEVLNTDAEGRLILCDALTYAERFQPQSVIDIATLTGACSAALGKHASGVMTNHEPLSEALIHAGQISGDRCWPLPLWEEYDEALNTPIADLANIAPGSTGEAGAMIAGCFLARFTKKYHWAHLDVAGTAAVYAGRERQASGRPLPLLTQYLLGQCTHDT